MSRQIISEESSDETQHTIRLRRSKRKITKRRGFEDFKTERPKDKTKQAIRASLATKKMLKRTPRKLTDKRKQLIQGFLKTSNSKTIGSFGSGEWVRAVVQQLKVKEGKRCSVILSDVKHWMKDSADSDFFKKIKSKPPKILITDSESSSSTESQNSPPPASSLASSSDAEGDMPNINMELDQVPTHMPVLLRNDCGLSTSTSNTSSPFSSTSATPPDAVQRTSMESPELRSVLPAKLESLKIRNEKASEQPDVISDEIPPIEYARIPTPEFFSNNEAECVIIMPLLPPIEIGTLQLNALGEPDISKFFTAREAIQSLSGNRTPCTSYGLPCTPFECPPVTIKPDEDGKKLIISADVAPPAQTSGGEQSKTAYEPLVTIKLELIEQDIAADSNQVDKPATPLDINTVEVKSAGAGDADEDIIFANRFETESDFFNYILDEKMAGTPRSAAVSAPTKETVLELSQCLLKMLNGLPPAENDINKQACYHAASLLELTIKGLVNS